MIYCVKCARILEEDTRQCPYCGGVEDELPGGETQDNTPAEADVTKAIELPEPDSFHAEPGGPLPETKPPQDNEPQTEAPKDNEPETEPEPVILETRQYDASSGPADIVETEPFLSLGAKIAITAGCLLFPPAGVVAAIVFMSRGHESYRSFGQILLTVMLVEMGLGCGCCCLSGFSGVFYYV